MTFLRKLHKWLTTPSVSLGYFLILISIIALMLCIVVQMLHIR